MSATAIVVKPFDPTAKKRPKKSVFALGLLLQSFIIPVPPPSFLSFSPFSSIAIDADESELADFGTKRAKKAESGAAPEPAAKSNAAMYEQLLKRIYTIMEQHNPDHGTRSERVVIQPPSTKREGKKTIWYNFTQICEQFVQDPA